MRHIPTIMSLAITGAMMDSYGTNTSNDPSYSPHQGFNVTYLPRPESPGRNNERQVTKRVNGRVYNVKHNVDMIRRYKYRKVGTLAEARA